jgi:Zn-dependent protease
MSRRELTALLTALLVLGLSFSVSYLFTIPALTLTATVEYLKIFLLTILVIGTGFIGHELAHKFTAQRYGCWAEFKLWTYGALMALLFAIVSQGRFVFAAPGAVYIVSRSSFLGEGLDRKTNGIVSAVGPVVNIIAAVGFLLALVASATAFGVQAIPTIGRFNFLLQGVTTNLVLGAFNMLPIFILDGQKVYMWNRKIWALLSIPLWIAVFTVPWALELWMDSLPA